MKFTGLLLVMLSTSAQVVRYTKTEQQKFIDTQINPILQMIMTGQLPYPEINDRIKVQNELIKKNFNGVRGRIRLIMSYSPVHERVPAASGISPTGEPQILLYIPAIMEDYFGNQSSLIRKIMHERDHLTEMKKNELMVNLGQEIHFQALTTKFVTVPLKEKYKVVLSRNDQRHYDAWVEAGRSEKSSVWRNHIKELLSPVLK